MRRVTDVELLDDAAEPLLSAELSSLSDPQRVAPGTAVRLGKFHVLVVHL